MSKTELAIRKQQEADRLMSDPRPHSYLAAERLEREASELLAPVNCELALGEALPDSADKFVIRDTLEAPNCISIEASGTRLDLLCDANALEMGLDCSEAIGAKNSVEKMMAHQMSAMHALSMKLLARAGDPALPTVEAARLANSARGLVESFQNITLSVQKLRSGGRQSIVVQRIEVKDDAQALIAGGGVHAAHSK